MRRTGAGPAGRPRPTPVDDRPTAHIPAVGPGRAKREPRDTEIKHHRRPVRTFRAIGVFVLVVGAVAGTYLGISQYQNRGNGVTALSVDAVPVLPAVDPARQAALEDAQDRAAEAAVDAASRAKKAAEVAKRQAQEQAASRSESRTKYPVPSSCKAYTKNRAIGCALLLEWGFKLDQMPCLDRLWSRESGWNPKAQNPGSGAYGIPQALPGNKMASVASDWRTNPVTQIKWGLGYIKNRYGDPCGAWSFFQSHNWY